MQELIHRTKDILDNNMYLTIATSDYNTPWISNLYFAYDKDFNIYWYSSKETKHSRNINNNPKVAISIFNSMAIGDDVQAVYIQAQATEITNKLELSQALILYAKKCFKTNFIQNKIDLNNFTKHIEDFRNSSPLRMYKATTKRLWLLAPSKIYNGKYIDSIINVPLS